MIRSILFKSKGIYSNKVMYPKYNFSNARPDPNEEKYDCENEKWIQEEQPKSRGGSEVNVNNPRVRPTES